MLWIPMLAGIMGAAAGGAPATPPTIRGSLFYITSSSITPHDVDTSTLAWAAGDITLVTTSVPAAATLTAAPAGQDVTGADTYAELEFLVGTNIQFYLHQGTITSPFDAVTRFTLSTARRIGAGFINIQNSSGINVQSPGETGNSTTPTSASVNTTVDNCLVLSMFGVGGGHDPANITQPTGWTLLDVETALPTGLGTETNQVTYGVSYKTQATAGATGAAAWGGLVVARDWAASTIALAPA